MMLAHIGRLWVVGVLLLSQDDLRTTDADIWRRLLVSLNRGVLLSSNHPRRLLTGKLVDNLAGRRGERCFRASRDFPQPTIDVIYGFALPTIEFPIDLASSSGYLTQL